MFRSMTGFGRSELQSDDYTCKVEIRSVNNRFLDVKTRLPRNFANLEFELKKRIKDKCSRGSIDVSISFQRDETEGSGTEIRPNLVLATQYLGAFKLLRDKLGLSGEIDISTILSLKDVIQFEPLALSSSIEELIINATEAAMDQLIEMRNEEGKHLEKEILELLNEVEKQKDLIKPRQSIMVKQYRDRLNERIKSLTEGTAIEPGRLDQEVALLAERCDITEEITRLESHLSHFRQLVQSEEPMGRKLEFLIQEFNREANTIGSKTLDIEVSRSSIEIKSALEKIREQLANIE
ncbi:MAG: YicC family protein [Nitrospinae bacterium CG11_big_fil_rev_8_21_14_0_20_45_15]|nr:MAG: YicC family protein [Nitrospinae bacterium CG11_big_fil_rev_8_21_14_0_20_45_15]